MPTVLPLRGHCCVPPMCKTHPAYNYIVQCVFHCTTRVELRLTACLQPPHNGFYLATIVGRDQPVGLHGCRVSDLSKGCASYLASNLGVSKPAGLSVLVCGLCRQREAHKHCLQQLQLNGMFLISPLGPINMRALFRSRSLEADSQHRFPTPTMIVSPIFQSSKGSRA